MDHEYKTYEKKQRKIKRIRKKLENKNCKIKQKKLENKKF